MGIAHIDMMPVFYGLIMFLGVWSMYHKVINGKYFAFAIECGVFVLVFTLHGGSMNGGFAAMICALIAGAVLPRMRRKP